MLRRILHKRVGAHVPIEPQKLPIAKNDFLLKSDCKKITVSIVRPTIDEIQGVKDFMFKTFYKEAPIPIVLKLGRNCQETRTFIDKELELFMNSGVSIKFCDDSGSIKGIGFSCVWNQNPKYEIIGAPVKNWHNAAADIAKTVNEEYRHIIWRDLQWQHIYDLGQKFLLQSRKKKIFYLAMLYLNPEIRASKIAEKAVREMIFNMNSEQCSYLCQSNFRGFDKSVTRFFKNPLLLDSVKYSEENLVLTESEGRAFRVIDHLDGIRFYADI